MEIYLYANLNRTFGAPDCVIAFQSREAVNKYIERSYDWIVLCTIDRHGKLPEGAETLDEFRQRVWKSCVTKSELWTEAHVTKDWEMALKQREEKKRKELELEQLRKSGELKRMFKRMFDPTTAVKVDLPF